MTRRSKTNKKNSASGKQSNKQTPASKSKVKTGSDALVYKSTKSTNLVQPPGVSNNRVAQVRPYEMLQAMRPKVSPAGMSFLKCAFAPPDFSGSDVRGVPDSYAGKSLIKKHRYIGDYTFASGRDTYIILAPIPGWAYWIATVGAGTPILNTTIFNGVAYSDIKTLFGDNAEGVANLVNKFRYVSNHFELIPTTNAMTWTGNIQAFRFPLSLFVRQNTGTTSANLLSISGLNALNSTNADQYTGPFNMGCYTAAYNTGNGFDFNPVLERVVNLPFQLDPGDFGQLVVNPLPIPGLDANFDCVCIKVSGVGSNSLDTCIIKTWACVEYQAVPGSSVYEYQTFSACDAQALAMYRAIIRELPVGVSFVDNEGFWQRCLAIIRKISSAGSNLPGQYGAIASGVNMATTALESLLF